MNFCLNHKIILWKKNCDVGIFVFSCPWRLLRLIISAKIEHVGFQELKGFNRFFFFASSVTPQNLLFLRQIFGALLTARKSRVLSRFLRRPDDLALLRSAVAHLWSLEL